MTQIQVGTEIPELGLPPISRYTLALYAGASGDHNPIHIDSDFAREASMPDVFAHGMLSSRSLCLQWRMKNLADRVRVGI